LVFARLRRMSAAASGSLDFAWEWDPWISVPLAASILLYATGLMRTWKRAGVGRGATAGQVMCFSGGSAVLIGALVSPLHEYGEHLFSAHMVEHELLMAAAAPLLAASRPLGMFLHSVPRGMRLRLIGAASSTPVHRAWHWLVKPFNATALHAAAIWLWHIPVLLDGTLVSESLHRLQHVSFLGTALVFWWAIIRRPRSDYGLGSLHIFVTMVHTGLLGALLTLATRVLYPLQTAQAPLFGLSPLEDQQLAGLIMWVPGGLSYLAAGLLLAGLWLTSGRKEIKRMMTIAAATAVENEN
jgi:cytochrome c oxidase assembly factor CtaG